MVADEPSWKTFLKRQTQDKNFFEANLDRKFDLKHKELREKIFMTILGSVELDHLAMGAPIFTSGRV